MASSPTQRSLALMRKEGYSPWVTEHWNQFARKRLDLYNFIDLVAIKDGARPIAIQTTSYSNVSARIKKIRENEYFPIIAQFMTIEVHGWHKVKHRYQVRRVEVTPDD